MTVGFFSLAVLRCLGAENSSASTSHRNHLFPSYCSHTSWIDVYCTSWTFLLLLGLEPFKSLRSAGWHQRVFKVSCTVLGILLRLHCSSLWQWTGEDACSSTSAVGFSIQPWKRLLVVSVCVFVYVNTVWLLSVFGFCPTCSHFCKWLDLETWIFFHFA